MPSELPTGDLAVYIFLEFFALGFALEAVWAFVHDPVWWKWIAWTCCVLLFFISGLKWPWVRLQIGSRFAAKVDQLASSRRYQVGAALLFLGYFGITGLLYLHTSAVTWIHMSSRELSLKSRRMIYEITCRVAKPTP
jgi:hypothetical protein